MLVPLVSIILGTLPSHAAAFAVVGVGLCLTAAMFAVGIGSAYPIYETREFWGSESVVPSTLVMMGYPFVISGLIVTWFAVTENLVLTPVFFIEFTMYLLLTVGVSYSSNRYAIRRYRQNTID